MVYVFPTTDLRASAAETPPASGRPQLGDMGLELDPKFLLPGLALIFAAAFLLGGKAEPKRRKRKQEAISEKIAKLRSELRALEA